MFYSTYANIGANTSEHALEQASEKFLIASSTFPELLLFKELI